MKLKLVTLFSSPFLFFASVLIAQNFSTQFRHYSIEEGLSEANVRCIVQDQHGFLWLGAQDGLNRYDGYEFTVFKYDKEDSSSISGNFINCIIEDKNGIIWIGANKGLCSFNSSTAKFTRYNFGEKNKRISSLYEDGGSFLWVGFARGTIIKIDNNELNFFSVKKNQIRRYNFSRRTVTSIIEDKNGNMWFGTSGAGLFELIASSGVIKHFSKADSHNGLISNTINDLEEDEEGDILIGTQTGVSVYYPNQNRFSQIYDRSIRRKNTFDFSQLNGKTIKTIYIDKDGFLWIGSLLHGLFFLDDKKNRLINFKKDELNPYSINNNNIFSIYESDDKILWIGTGKGGLNKLDKSEKRFINITKLSAGISNSSIGAVLEDKTNSLWIGTDWGLNKIERRSGKTTIFLKEKNSPRSLNGNKVTSLGQDAQGNIWIGTNFGLNEYIPSRGKIIGYLHDPSDVKSLPNNNIKDIFCDSTNIWLGTAGGGLILFKPDGNKFVQFRLNPENKNSIADNTVSYIFKNDEGRLLICGETTVTAFNQVTEKFEKFLTLEKDNSAAAFFAGVQESDSVYWFGTDVGLVKFNAILKEYFIYDEKNGLSNNNVYSVILDSKNILWMSTNHGISEYIKETGNFINYYRQDGLVCNEFNSRAFFKNKSGDIFFGSIEGLTYFNPDSVKISSKTRTVVISKFNVFNKQLVENKFYANGEEIDLDYTQNFISIEFTSLDFSEQSFNEYAYKLENVDNEWVYSGSRRFASYTQLSPGRYIFTVKPLQKNRLLKGKGTSLIITITPPFWQTWQFKIIPPIIVISIIVLFISVKIRNIIEIERLRVKIASDLHDDVGASLSKISMVAGLLSYELDKRKIHDSANKLINISQEVISTMSDIVWSIDARNDTAADLIDRMKTFALNQTADKNIEVNIETKCLSPNKKIRINVKQNIYLIFKEAVNNAVKYSGSDEFNLQIIFSNKLFEFALSDNGCGLSESAVGKGNGLRNMKMRADKINGKLKFIRKNGLTISLEVRC